MGEDVKHIGELKPDERNPRKHNARNIGMIERSLNEVGAARSIVIDEHDTILAGNGVVEAAAQAGIERVRVVEADGNELIAVRRRGLTEEQKRKLAYYDNRTAELAEWDVEQIAADLEFGLDFGAIFREEELRELLAGLEHEKKAPEAQIDRAVELQKKWQTARGQLWEIGKHRLLCGDSTNAEDVARLSDGERPLLMVTDPPYGVNYDPSWRNEAAEEGLLSYAASRVGKVANDDRADWSDAWRLFPGDVVYTWSPPGDHVIITGAALQAAGYQIRAMLIWVKPHIPIGRGHYCYQHEPVWYAVRKGAAAHWIGGHMQPSVWKIALDKNVDGGHSTQKPVECMARPIRNHEGDVYDPFIGSGTTMVAAEQLGRRCFGMEIEPKYVAVCLERMANMGLTPRLVSDPWPGEMGVRPSPRV